MPSVLFLAFGNQNGGHGAAVFVVVDLKTVGIAVLQGQPTDHTGGAEACGSGLETFVLLEHFQFRDDRLAVAHTIVGDGKHQGAGIFHIHGQLNVEGILHAGGGCRA